MQTRPQQPKRSSRKTAAKSKAAFLECFDGLAISYNFRRFLDFFLFYNFFFSTRICESRNSIWLTVAPWLDVAEEKRRDHYSHNLNHSQVCNAEIKWNIGIHSKFHNAMLQFFHFLTSIANVVYSFFFLSTHFFELSLRLLNF